MASFLFFAKPATEEQLLDFEARFGPIPSDYRWFLENFGGGGPDELPTIENLPEEQKAFLDQAEDRTLSPSEFFLIGWDGFGDPFGIERATGRILTEYHDCAGLVDVMAPSFEALCLEWIHGNPFHESFHNWDEERIERYHRTGDAAPLGGWPEQEY